MIRTPIGLCLLTAPLLFADTYDIKGTVVNSTGKPIANATVKLIGKDLKDTTDANGSFAFLSTPSSINTSTELPAGITYSNGVLEYSISIASPVTIEVFNANGKLQKREFTSSAQPGRHQFRIKDKGFNSSQFIIRAKIGTQNVSIQPNALAMRGNSAIAVDTIVTSATNYITDSLAIPFNSVSTDIKLDTFIETPVTPFTGSAGCGKPAGLTTGTKSITSANKARQYIIDIPANYDSSHPYRLIFGLHWMYGSMGDVNSGTTVPGGGVWAYYGLKRLANNSTIFIAPQGLGSPSGWGQGDADLTFFDDMVKLAKSNLCVDTTRIFATGFSFGGAMSHVLAAKRPNIFRAVVVQDGGTMSGDPAATGAIPYMGVHGHSPNDFVPISWGRSIRDKFVSKNGCTAGQSPNEVTDGSRTHTCYDYKGCKTNYPVRWCTFDGTHHGAPYDGPLVNNNEDNGATTWVPAAAWAFITQF